MEVLHFILHGWNRRGLLVVGAAIAFGIIACFCLNRLTLGFTSVVCASFAIVMDGVFRWIKSVMLHDTDDGPLILFTPVWLLGVIRLAYGVSERFEFPKSANAVILCAWIGLAVLCRVATNSGWEPRRYARRRKKLRQKAETEGDNCGRSRFRLDGQNG